jgi:4-hydroxy-2-oxoheptanedioate aldolase
VSIVRPETPQDGGIHGVGARRFAFMSYGGTPEYVEALRDVVVMIMIEKKQAVEQLEEILSVEGIDTIQWGGADYSMSIGRPGERNSPEVKAIEHRVIKTALDMGVPPRAEIMSPDQAKYYLELGVRHFSIGTDIFILHNWWKEYGEGLRKMIENA